MLQNEGVRQAHLSGKYSQITVVNTWTDVAGRDLKPDQIQLVSRGKRICHPCFDYLHSLWLLLAYL